MKNVSMTLIILHTLRYIQIIRCFTPKKEVCISKRQDSLLLIVNIMAPINTV